MPLIEDVLNEVGEAVQPVGEEDRERANKAGHIRTALDVLGDDVKPAEIVDWIRRERGVEVTPAYVSLIKTQSRKAVPKQLSAQVYLAAKALIKAAGGVTQAKQALAAIDSDREFVVALRDRYQVLLSETEKMLTDEGGNLKRRERRELVNECRNLRRMLTNLNDVESGVL
jgi:hypothetical protein